MTKKDLINRIATMCYTKRDSAQVYDDVMLAIRNSLLEGEEVMLQGIGSFSIVRRSPRRARNVVTGEMVVLPGHNTVKFSAFKSLKDDIKAAEVEQE